MLLVSLQGPELAWDEATRTNTKGTRTVRIPSSWTTMTGPMGGPWISATMNDASPLRVRPCSQSEAIDQIRAFLKA